MSGADAETAQSARGEAVRGPDPRTAIDGSSRDSDCPWPLPDHPGAQLRELREDDAAELHAAVERNRPRLARWMLWAREQTERETLEFIREARARAAAGNGIERAIVVEGRIAGVVGVPAVDRVNRSAEIGYWLDRDHEGRGLMTAAVRAIVDHAFSAWHLNRVQIRMDVENLPSRAVAERLGFRYEGVLRQAYWVGDRYSDDAVYSMLACDWPLARR